MDRLPFIYVISIEDERKNMKTSYSQSAIIYLDFVSIITNFIESQITLKCFQQLHGIEASNFCRVDGDQNTLTVSSAAE